MAMYIRAAHFLGRQFFTVNSPLIIHAAAFSTRSIGNINPANKISSGSRNSKGANNAKSKGNNGGIIKNEEIQLATMRVVYKDIETGESEWKVLTRKEALSLAKKQSLDLILVDAKSDPPVCRLANFGQMLMEKRSKEKEKKTSQKAKTLKEIYVSAGIDPHDLGIKLNKCKEFLEDGHQVKIVLTVTKVALSNNPLALDETTLKVLENIENHVGTVQQPPGANPMRKDFLLNPKKDEKVTPKKNLAVDSV